MATAADGPADVAIFDLEDAVVPENKTQARTMVNDFLKANATRQDRLWVRINPLDGPRTLDDFAAIMPARRGGIMLPKV